MPPNTDRYCIKMRCDKCDWLNKKGPGCLWVCARIYHSGLSLPRFDSLHPNHDRHEFGVVGAEESSAVAGAVACTFVGDAEPDSARVTSSAKRNRSSKAIRSSAALSRVASILGIGLAAPYAHEPATTAATVSPCATMRTRSQLLNERDWPFRILVIAITSAAVVAAAPVGLLGQQALETFLIGDVAPTGTRGCCLNLRSAFSR
jgi:hypothetical protein